MFKVGDKVVDTGFSRADEFSVKEWTGVITKTDEVKGWYLIQNIAGEWFGKEESLVLEEIYNSPLYKLLKEEI